MKILALEFSSPQRSVAVVRGRAEAAPPESSEVVESGGRATRAFGLIEEALRQAQLEREQIECLAVGLGPGSYTGIRAAIAVAQGWQLAREVKILGLASAVAVAAQAQAEGLSGRVAVVIDAQRGEFYLAGYELSAAGWRERQALRLASLAEVRSEAQAGSLIIGPEVTNWFPDARVIFPRASMLGRLALRRTDFVAGEEVEPIYLRTTAFVKAPPPRILPG
ncbi:MAG TPA: tRNA (adenosine(37)-N6)-threonylcarbamoyltransferase complex dimerization subunit type 1 TsaB [Candidatus Acidoferrum sp.]|jgi:tRNA threonylcarbamoyl adenosine modification protein YeaZ|nr:tRNA (adenosine(37)-N6)-threonylcarbamoyltransferase complex dimerization subunit type 1 TsaB [Candidatus Acidoferrum sp.]